MKVQTKGPINSKLTASRKAKQNAHSKSDLMRAMFRRNINLKPSQVLEKLKQKGLQAYASEIYRIKFELMPN